jgi:hypothetical protein
VGNVGGERVLLGKDGSKAEAFSIFELLRAADVDDDRP